MKVKALADMSVPMLDRAHISAGEILDVPETQGDGSPIIWPPEYWEVVAEKPAKSAKKEG